MPHNQNFPDYLNQQKISLLLQQAEKELKEISLTDLTIRGRLLCFLAKHFPQEDIESSLKVLEEFNLFINQSSAFPLYQIDRRGHELKEVLEETHLLALVLCELEKFLSLYLRKTSN